MACKVEDREQMVRIIHMNQQLSKHVGHHQPQKENGISSRASTLSEGPMTTLPQSAQDWSSDTHEAKGESAPGSRATIRGQDVPDHRGSGCSGVLQ